MPITEPAEKARLTEDGRLKKNWKRWGPYLADRQWGTVREDYSPRGESWKYFPHDHARSRAYRWGEDGLLGFTDRECRLCFGLALWNERDPILKERLFGLTGPEGNHGEDVKECYYYLDNTPTHSYMRALYKYPQGAFPYDDLVRENRRRGLNDPEYELTDTGIFDDNRYFDVVAEYAKGGPDDILVRIIVTNRGPNAARLHLLPTIWFRNTWSWGRTGDDYPPRPTISRGGKGTLVVEHSTLGTFQFHAGPGSLGETPEFLFTENETNAERLFGGLNSSPFVKDAFHDYIVQGRTTAINPAHVGSKAAAHYAFEIASGDEASIVLRLSKEDAPSSAPLGTAFSEIFELRRREANEFYDEQIPPDATDDERAVMRQAYAGLLWTKQFFNYVVRDWLAGDPDQIAPATERKFGRNSEWSHVHCRDVISMPDKWEYPWFAAWDLAFHMIAFARLDAKFAKDQLLLFLREWYMHPNGQLPAYEFALGDVNPPVHAWACWRVYKMSGTRENRDRVFLARAFQKLLINFTWWVNRKDAEGRNLFSGGFLGLDNIGVFDRSRPLPTGGKLEQADGTAWMAFYCATMLSMALELAREDPAYEDLASKFLEHFVAIADAMNAFGGDGLWDDDDGFYYDRLHVGDAAMPLRVRSLVGVIPLFACELLEDDLIETLPGFQKRLHWFLNNRKDLLRYNSATEVRGFEGHTHRLLAIPSRERLQRVLRYVLDEDEFLSTYGVRSVSRVHRDHPYVFHHGVDEYHVDYVPGEGNTHLFGGNSNWRGPIWFPLNYLLIEALERYDHFFDGDLKVECPVGSGHYLTLEQVARDLDKRLASLFLRDANGRRPCHGNDRRYATDDAWKELVLFHEYFDAETGRGIGASHQTGWTALAALCVERIAKARGGTAAYAYRPSGPMPVVRPAW
ncbi:MAG: glucosidase [Gemmatimonadaceae bacterium]